MSDSPSQMEPMMPLSLDPFADQVIELIRKSAALGASIPEKTKGSLVEILRMMNSYYSNRIEDHHTHPHDIERAMRTDYSKDPAKMALQLESRAHVEVQKLIETRLHDQEDLSISSQAFLCYVHREFYTRMPEEYCIAKGPQGQEYSVVPGKLRDQEVTVGRHVAPKAKELSHFLARFEKAYDKSSTNQIAQILAIAASHHRLAWIHPFLDGNGRVTRLFTDACLQRLSVSGHGLWVVSRGLSRCRDDYFTALTWADALREGDLDGRGTLSNKGLVRFCDFFLNICIDQVDFMSSLLELETFKRRVLGYLGRQIAEGLLKSECHYLMEAVVLRGEIARGEAARITGLEERTARKRLGSLIEQSLLVSDTPKGPVRLAFPAKVLEYYFPRLYPEGI